MIIRPKKRENPYAQIDNRVLNDKRLSWRCRGILAYLLSKPADWKVSAENIVNMGTEGRDAVRTAFREAADHGYARLAQTRDGKEWHVFETPEEPCPENPSLGHALKKPTPEKANVGKSDTTNTEVLTKTDSETKTEKVAILQKQLARIRLIFHKRPETSLDRSEKAAWKLLTDSGKRVLDEAELALVEKFYAKHWPPNRDKNHLRHAMAQLMNNWGGEVDKARAAYEKRVKPVPRRDPEPVMPLVVVPSKPIPIESAEGKVLKEFHRRNNRWPAGFVERDGFLLQERTGTHS